MVASPSHCRYRSQMSDLAPDTKRIRELDGVRGVACVLVLLWHLVAGQITAPTGVGAFVRTLLSQTWSGVDLFFCLSGYLITRNLVNDRSNAGWVRRFTSARIFRLLPAYALLLFASVIVSRWVAASHYVSNTQLYLVSGGHPLWVYLLFLQNWYPLFAHVIRPLGSSFLSASWSLGAEVEFYIGTVLMFLFIPSQWRVRVFAGAIVMALLFRLLILAYFPNPFLTTFILPLARMDSFAMGGLVALWLYRPKYTAKKSFPILAWCWLLSLLFIAVLTLEGVPYAGIIPALFSYSCFAVFYSTSIAYVVSLSGHQRVRWLRNPVLVSIGTISYSVYLFHLPFHSLYANAMELPEVYLGLPNGYLYLILEVALLFLLAGIVWIALEKPAIVLGRRLTKERYAHEPPPSRII